MSELNSAWPWPNTYGFGELSLIGNSLAGQGTSLLCPELKIAFDVAFGLPYLLPARDFFISHAHMDHAGGIPYLISQKNLMSLPAPRLYMPESTCGPMTRVLNTWQEMEGHVYDYRLIGLKEGDWVPLKGSWGVRSFRTHHRVPSLGYTLFKLRKRLKPEYRDFDRQALLDLKSRGETLEDNFEEAYLSFTGDTQIEFLEGPAWVRESKLLVMEVTYIDEKKSPASAREWGHIHLEELLAYLPRLKNERLLLIHLSARYKCRELRELLARRLPPEWQGRVDVFPRDED
jgi:ribonuclease Z